MPLAPDLDFDALVALHKKDPEAFDQFRTRLLLDFIASAPAEHRSSLVRLKEEADAVRVAARSPLECAAAAAALMSGAASRLGAQFEALLEECANNQTLHLMQRLRLPVPQDGANNRN